MAEGGISGGVDGAAAPQRPVPAARTRRRWRHRHVPRLGVRLILFLVLLSLGVLAAGMVLTGRTLHLPVWAVAEVEDRLNRTLGAVHLPPGSALSLGGVEIAVDRDLVPRFVLRDLRLMDGAGKALLGLSEARLSLDPGALLSGEVRPRSLRLSGARLALERDAEGRLGLSFAGLSGSPGLQDPAQLLDALDRMFARPALSGLTLVEADALTLTLQDARAGRRWEVGDGRLVLESRESGLAAELSLTLLDGVDPAQARVVIETAKSDSSARMTATVTRVAAADLAAQAAPLAPLAVLDAPISGEISGALTAEGQVGQLEARLQLGQGALRPDPEAAPVPFDSADMALHYDPATQRVTLKSLSVESPSLRLKATGHSDLLDASGAPVARGALPRALVTQLDFSEVMVDPEGVFASPVRFSDGVLDLKLQFRPFRLQVGQLVLTEGEERLSLTGRAEIAEDGWKGGLDVALNAIEAQRLMRLWPVSAVPGTRKWLSENVGQAEFTNFKAALRFAENTPPRFALGYEFSGAEVRFIRTLPPIQEGHGRATIEGNVYTVVVDGGHVTAPQGGRIAVGGSVMTVPDITKFPATAEVRLITDAPLTATLSLLDQEPFHFLQKAERPVDLGQGRAVLASDLRFPLIAKITAKDVEFNVSGRILDFASDKIVPGRSVTSPDMAVKVTNDGLSLSGEGLLGPMPIVARYDQRFNATVKGQATVRGSARISDAWLRALGISLPQGWLRGETGADVTLDLAKDQPARLHLESDLVGATLSVAPLSWSKGAKAKGKLALDAMLGTAPEVTALSLSAPGLAAEGRITTKAGGGLDLASFSRLKAGTWLDAPADIRGTGKAGITVTLNGGTLDLRNRPPGGDGSGSGGGASVPIKVNLDRLVVSSGIAITGFSGNFRQRAGGLDGTFVGAVNGAGRIEGATVPVKGGTAIRIRSGNAGAVMAAAGIFDKGRGGSMDLTLQPRGAEGNYLGIGTFKNLSVQGAPALAELLSAVSVVGLLEQLNGNGILFGEGDVEFTLQPEGVQVRRGAAVGASMGISFAGLYRSGSGQLDIQGTISPLYLLNGIGQIFTRKGEGLFGFNYRITGTSDNPQVSVNPLSILTPGMFREIFRQPPPVLEQGG
ncbi:hypothetical protein [Neotabrizicola sp. sgz301269]|uniref:hypothetical protein n=1 Tax=Neotabrizicola sp. sgz301269 TaxID=3276282 RepID=UPI00376FB622